MSEAKFPKMLDYEKLKQQFGEHPSAQPQKKTKQTARVAGFNGLDDFSGLDNQRDHDFTNNDFTNNDFRNADFQNEGFRNNRVNETDTTPIATTLDENAFNAEQDLAPKPKGLTGTRLRSYAFAVLTRKEYSKAELIEKLATWAQSREEVLTLVDELAEKEYQSDQRVAEMTVRSQVRKGKGPNRIKLALRAKQLDKELVQEDLAEIDWREQAYELKVKKYGTEVTKDPKLKAKQIRFLQYRGFDMDAIFKAISRKENED